MPDFSPPFAPSARGPLTSAACPLPLCAHSSPVPLPHALSTPAAQGDMGVSLRDNLLKYAVTVSGAVPALVAWALKQVSGQQQHEHAEAKAGGRKRKAGVAFGTPALTQIVSAPHPFTLRAAPQYFTYTEGGALDERPRRLYSPFSKDEDHLYMPDVVAPHPAPLTLTSLALSGAPPAPLLSLSRPFVFAEPHVDPQDDPLFWPTGAFDPFNMLELPGSTYVPPLYARAAQLPLPGCPYSLSPPPGMELNLPPPLGACGVDGAPEDVVFTFSSEVNYFEEQQQQRPDSATCALWEAPRRSVNVTFPFMRAPLPGEVQQPRPAPNCLWWTEGVGDGEVHANIEQMMLDQLMQPQGEGESLGPPSPLTTVFKSPAAYEPPAVVILDTGPIIMNLRPSSTTSHMQIAWILCVGQSAALAPLRRRHPPPLTPVPPPPRPLPPFSHPAISGCWPS